MGGEALIARWSALWSAPAEGWDFSEFEGRIVEEEPPWSYDALVRQALATARSALDLGTGGGEFLLGLGEALADDMHATEGWPPNVPIARAALEPRGIPVAEYDAERGGALPYPDQRFDVVISRHEAYEAREVARVLRPGGTFLTQQVDGRNLEDLSAVFDAGPSYPDVTLDVLRREAEQAGLVVQRAEEWTGVIRFADVDTLVSYLRLMPWQLPADFTVERYADRLLALEAADEPVAFTEGRFLLVCREGRARLALGPIHSRRPARASPPGRQPRRSSWAAPSGLTRSRMIEEPSRRATRILRIQDIIDGPCLTPVPLDADKRHYVN